MDPITWLWNNAEKVGVVFLLGLGLLAFVKGWVVTKREHDRVIKDCETHREMNQRLLDKLERAVTVAEVVTVKKRRDEQESS